MATAVHAASAPAKPEVRNRLKLSPGWPRGSTDAAVAAAVLAMIALMILPVRPAVLDVFLTLNLAVGAVLLMAAVLTPSGARVFTFPTILILITLFRLALDVSSTRLILTEGDAGQVIQAFGQFAAGGSVVVGLVVFLVITLVQLIVISKGAERTANANAVFVRESIAGRQAAIDADAHAKRISSAQVTAARRSMNIEVEFFGRMYGAMEFIKGDAVAGLVISAINIVGGLIIGVAVNQMPINEALETYTILSIGAGLVSQIPALVGSTAGTILVSRVSADEGEDGLGAKTFAQFAAMPKALLLGGGMLGLLGLVPGMPTVPFLLICAALGWAGYRLERSAGPARAVATVCDALPFAPSAVLATEFRGADQELLNRLRAGINRVLARHGDDSGIPLPAWSLRELPAGGGEPVVAIRRRGVLIYSGDDMETALASLSKDLLLHPAEYFGPDEASRWLEIARAGNEHAVKSLEAVINQSQGRSATPLYDFLKLLVEERIPINMTWIVVNAMLPMEEKGNFSGGEKQSLIYAKHVRLELRDHTARYLKRNYWRESSRCLLLDDVSPVAQDLQAAADPADPARVRVENYLLSMLGQENSDSPAFLVSAIEKRRVWQICEELFRRRSLSAPVIVLYPEESQAAGLEELTYTNI